MALCQLYLPDVEVVLWASDVGVGIPALVGRFKEESSKGLMRRDLGLGDWLFDSDIKTDMDRLIPTVLSLAQDPVRAKNKTLEAKEYVKKNRLKL